jgi:hypothetical protein
MKLLSIVAILTIWCAAPARAATVYTGFCLSCGIGSQRLLFSNQTPDGLSLTGITAWTGHEVTVAGDGQDVLQTKGGWSSVRPVDSGFSEASFTIAGAGFREMMLWIGVSDDVPLTVTVDGSEVLGPFLLHDEWFNYINVQVPESSLMTLVTLSVPGNNFTSLNLIRFDGISDFDWSGGETPEPGTVTLMISGLAAICCARRRAKRCAVTAADD